jgi:hypothetical protein
MPLDNMMFGREYHGYAAFRQHRFSSATRRRAMNPD